MTYLEYKKGVADCTTVVDTSRLKDQSVIVTGGAAGMGEQTVRAFVKAGAYVTFGDVNEARGSKIRQNWARRNAKFFQMKMIDVNLIGAIYTLKLARFYFLKNPEHGNRDRSFVIPSSAAGYADVPGGLIYTASKFGARGLMRCYRRSTILDGIRANVIVPWYVTTEFMAPAVMEHSRRKGVKFADPADAANAILKIQSDPSINGRSFTIIPRDNGTAPFGYRDQDLDDFEDGSFAEWQQETLLSISHRLQVKPQEQ